MNDIEKNILKKQAIWVGISLGISLAIWFGCAVVFGDYAIFISLPLTISVFIAMSFFITRRQLRNQGVIAGGKSTGKGYVCYQCSTAYKGNQCPKCGSRGGKMIFYGE